MTRAAAVHLSAPGRCRCSEVAASAGVLAGLGVQVVEDYRACPCRRPVTARELADLVHAAAADPDVDALWVVNGGEDATSTAAFLDPDRLIGAPPLIGSSDATAGLLAWQRAGSPAWYGPCLGWVGEMLPEQVQRWLEPLRTGAPHHHGLDRPLVGGCVEVMVMNLGSPVFPPLSAFAGRWLLLDVGDPDGTGRVVWWMRALGAAGVLGVVAGIAWGTSSSLDPGGEAAALTAATLEVHRELGLPVPRILTGLSAGHAGELHCWPLNGAPALLAPVSAAPAG